MQKLYPVSYIKLQWLEYKQLNRFSIICFDSVHHLFCFLIDSSLFKHPSLYENDRVNKGVSVIYIIKFNIHNEYSNVLFMGDG